MYVLYMQTLKPELKEDILRIAKELFFLRGFSGTTMRLVADGVQVSVSNLYKYFSDKDDLLEAVVGEYARRFKRNMLMELDHEDAEEFRQERWANMAQGLAKAINADHKSFFILMNQSRGCAYDGYKHEISDMVRDRIIVSARGINGKSFLAEVLALNLIDAIASIARRYGGTDEVSVVLTELFRYHMAGLSALD